MSPVRSRKGADELGAPAPEVFRALLKEVKISRQEVAGLLHVSTHLVNAWAATEGTSAHRAMPLMAWELLLLKLNRHPSKRVYDL